MSRAPHEAADAHAVRRDDDPFPDGRVAVDARGRRSILSGHPWVYADHVVRADAEAGALVAVDGPNDDRLGWAFFSPGSKLALRMVARDRRPDRAAWEGRVERAIARRAELGLLEPDGACRLVSAEADGFPGLVADLYAGVLVLQSGTAAADRLVPLVAGLVAARLPFPLVGAVERSQAAVRRLEGLEPREGVLSGALPDELWVRDGALWHVVDVRGGHKTGHYLDMRDNRRRAAARAHGRRVLDAFCYDGLFGIHAALAGAREVVCIDQSREAGERLARNAERNAVADRVRFERADCMHALRDLDRAGERFGLVVVDPPPFARNRRELAGAERGYVELNRRALSVCDGDGTLVSASCSSNVRPELFVDFLRKAAARAGRDAVLEELAGAAPDHPELLALPESRYLACAFLHVAPSGGHVAPSGGRVGPERLEAADGEG